MIHLELVPRQELGLLVCDPDLGQESLDVFTKEEVSEQHLILSKSLVIQN